MNGSQLTATILWEQMVNVFLQKNLGPTVAAAGQSVVAGNVSAICSWKIAK